MVERFNLDEIAESILTSGFLPYDPFIGCPDDGAAKIQEGNRRLATLKLLLEPERAPEKLRKKWRGFSSRLSDETRKTISSIEYLHFDDCESIDVASYIGFRHVTGILQWPPLEKASFIARLVQAGISYEEIADRLGSYPAHVERHYVAHQIWAQAEENGLDGARNLEDSFGVLLRSLQSPGVSEFIGVKFPKNPRASRRPIAAAKMEQLGEFVRWTFGTEKEDPVLEDSRDLTRWGQILESDDAVRYLRLTDKPDFERAWVRSGGQAQAVAETIWSAAYALESVVPLVSAYTDNGDVAASVRECNRYFVQILAHFPELTNGRPPQGKHARSS
jgi:hypothetical protein